MDLIYPEETRSIAFWGKFVNRYEHLEKSLSIHIFTSTEIEELSDLESQIGSLWKRSVLFSFLGTVVFFILWRRSVA